MSFLTSADLTQVLNSVAILNSGHGMDTLPERSLNCVLSLIPNEMTAFDGFDIEAEYAGSYWYSPPGTVPDERVKLFAELVHEHPYYLAAMNVQTETTFRVSDFVALPEFHRTTVYNEFYRSFGGDVQMAGAMRISPGCLMTCSLHRPDMDFSDRELEMLKLVTPHLAAAFRNAHAYEKIEYERKYLAAAVKRGIIVVGRSGEMIFINSTGERMLQSYFSEYRMRELPDDLKGFVCRELRNLDGDSYLAPTAPLVVKNERSDLLIRPAFDERNGELMLLLEERTARSPADLNCLGLTRRESEILLWMSKGKTDPEIATLCGISRRTVAKHAEHLFTKLGVETRTAAVMAAIERI